MIRKLPSLLFDKLRLSNPWRYKAPFLVSVPYFMILVEGLPPAEAVLAMLASCSTILGIAGFGYLVNDYTDREEDAKAGKFNVLIGMRGGYVLLLLLLFLALAVLPWVFYFPVDPVTGSLLGAEFLLFLLYSAPPFRLKERGAWGLLADALYAHANPALLAAYTFYLLGGEKYPVLLPFLVALGLWQGILGVRNILLHQLADMEKDRATGTRTLAAGKGEAALKRVMNTLVVPAEILALFAYLLVLSRDLAFMVPAYLAFMLLTWWKNAGWWGQRTPGSLRRRLYLYLDDFYVQWIPVLVLAGLCLRHWHFLFLLAAHVLLFRNALQTWARDAWGQVRHRFAR